jgi:DNA-binding Lrp family transcriptional regulator
METEREILKILENDARISPEKISVMTGKPVEEVSKIIKKAEKERIILKYKTLINWEKVGNEHVLALIEVRVTPQKGVGFDSIADSISRFPQANTVYLVSGTYDLLVIVEGKSNRDIADFVSQKLSHIDGVQETVTQFVLKKYKEDGETTQFKEETKRQPLVF